MTDGVWKGVYPYVFGRAKQLLKDKFFDPSTPSMRKWERKEKTDENSGHYIIASSGPPKRWLLERHTLVPTLFAHI